MLERRWLFYVSGFANAVAWDSQVTERCSRITDCAEGELVAVEQEEALEVASLRTELLQARVSLISSKAGASLPTSEEVSAGAAAWLEVRDADSSNSSAESLRNHSLTASQVQIELDRANSSKPLWCGEIAWIIQYLVPPCWFGAPDTDTMYDSRYTGGNAGWCKYVPSSSQHNIPACNHVMPMGSADGTHANVVSSAPPSQAQIQAAAAEWLVVRDFKSNRTHYSKARTDSPAWCGTIPYWVQYLVPPCWFGSPNDPVDVPHSGPSWCRYVPSHSKPDVPACSMLQYTEIRSDVPSETPPASFEQLTAAGAAWVEVKDVAANRRLYVRVRSDSPAWCGNIPYLVQFLVPPCWFGHPRHSEDASGSNPNWCKYVPNRSKDDVAACSMQQVDNSNPT